MEVSEACPLKTVEEENAMLTRLLADAMRDIFHFSPLGLWFDACLSIIPSTMDPSSNCIELIAAQLAG
jgi:hypothetical protein